MQSIGAVCRLVVISPAVSPHNYCAEELGPTTGCARSTPRPTWTSSCSGSTAAARLRRRSPASSASRSRSDRIPTPLSSRRAQRDKPISEARRSTSDFMRAIGVADLPPLTVVFDPGYDPATLEGHLEQSHPLMAALKISMACWIVAVERVTRRKIALARACGMPVVTGGGPFEISVAQRQLPAYLDLCADVGVSRIECGEGFTDMPLPAREVAGLARQRGLEIQFELGKKHGGAFEGHVIDELIEQGQRWLEAGAVEIVVEARESALGVGLFADEGNVAPAYADRFAEAFGLDIVTFEAPNKPSQFALLDHFGPGV